MSLVLFFDVGNTNTKICLADERGLGESYTLPTRPANTADDWGLKLEHILARETMEPADVEACVISSVVPPLDPLLGRMARRYLECEAVFVPGDLELPIANHYAQPEQVGADILVTAYAAREMYDHENIIVVDFGTATTLASIVGDAFMGGLICPGVLSSASALAGGTAKLPPVNLKLPYEEFRWGRSTSECLNQGLVYGFAEMVDGLCRRLAEQMDSPPQVVATGGLARDIADHCPAIAEVRPDLLMEGLWYAWFR
ncbi:type III pantothenate kinase [Pseudodesulfovibrio senegalensis]|uniref:Type III pantothenate kinase n=1 Tax=Pseudodesulfovibrio senegalensis TaxID=1721087 RepID=A0A6N6N566_9BACT|nr:type III pantothenate kinase [Pseudodesulfovibrio senegalensis]KAB1441891.1 type III pantothenate kinase [Pseudodesulfovibrio senegalensis]